MRNILCLLFYLKCEEFITETTEGLLQGYALKARNGRTVIGFSGIPYAKPPIGALRFQVNINSTYLQH